MKEKILGKLVDGIKRDIDLTNISLGEEYFYNSLSLCVIDAVFSIGVNYQSVQNTIRRYCDYYSLTPFRLHSKEDYPNHDHQETLDVFIKKIEDFGIEKFTNEVFQNRQRTSSQSGILKTEAVLKFAKILNEYSINSFVDITKDKIDPNLEKEIKHIPGQKSGISLRYFLMLAGNDNLIKPDRMIIRYVEGITSEKLSEREIILLIEGAVDILSKEYSKINARSLDYEIWNFQREQ